MQFVFTAEDAESAEEFSEQKGTEVTKGEDHN